MRARRYANTHHAIVNATASGTAKSTSVWTQSRAIRHVEVALARHASDTPAVREEPDDEAEDVRDGIDHGGAM